MLLLQQYPGLTFVGLSYIAAILLVVLLGPSFFHNLVTPFGIGGVFVAGMMYTYSFTAGFAVVFLPPFLDILTLPMIAIVGGVGAAFGDVLIFRFIKGNLHKEIARLSSHRVLRRVTQSKLFKPAWVRNTLGAIIIASPLPDEFGILVMANTKLKEENFAMISFIANTIGIYILVASLSLIY